jgi:alkanesulfonate monooxygenase SsuD/methylene tetrahydromethanopterin reductase-like flavin-dependent oxidoreductase (luciferase family)
MTTKKIAENTTEMFSLYTVEKNWGEDVDNLIDKFETRQAALAAAKRLQSTRWFITVSAIVAESKALADERAKRLTGVDA